VEGGRIRARLPVGAEPIDASARSVAGARPLRLGGRALSPGLIDLHHHGEVVLRAPDDAGEALRRESARLVRHGVTAWLPTTLAWPGPELGVRLERLAAAVTASAWPGALPLGLHLEGPWIRAEAAGAQPAAGIRPYDHDGRALLDRAEGAVRMATLAPEVAGAERLLDELERRGVVAALGHTLAGSGALDAAVARGARHVTHLFNAMGPLHQRGPGFAGLVLADDRLSCDVIADGAHVDPAWLRVASRTKGERLMLISDRIDPGDQRLAGGFGSGQIASDGRAWRLPDGRLAGSHLQLDDAVANAERWRVMNRHEALAACTLRPARLLGIEAERGTLRPGARADLALWSPAGELLASWVEGRLVYRAPAAPPL
jgi:N-acetylglucosamine-6-phosphate deacetylase